MPFTATVVCSTVHVAVVASRNKSARGLRAIVHDSASEVYLDEVNDGPSRENRALCSIRRLGWWPCRQRCTVPVINKDAYMYTQRLLKTLVTRRLRSASELKRGRWPPRASMRQAVAKGQEWHSDADYCHVGTSGLRSRVLAVGMWLCLAVKRRARSRESRERRPWQVCIRIGDEACVFVMVDGGGLRRPV